MNSQVRDPQDVTSVVEATLHTLGPPLIALAVIAAVFQIGLWLLATPPRTRPAKARPRRLDPAAELRRELLPLLQELPPSERSWVEANLYLATPAALALSLPGMVALERPELAGQPADQAAPELAWTRPYPGEPTWRTELLLSRQRMLDRRPCPATGAQARTTPGDVGGL